MSSLLLTKRKPNEEIKLDTALPERQGRDGRIDLDFQGLLALEGEFRDALAVRPLQGRRDQVHLRCSDEPCHEKVGRRLKDVVRRVHLFDSRIPVACMCLFL